MAKRSLAVLSLSSLLFLPNLALARLRAMPVDELTREAILIARIKVTRADKASFRGQYNQLALLQIVDMIEGDSTLKEVRVWSQSQVFSATDSYKKGDEMLVFLEREITFFKTLNYQYGQFLIENEMVKGWRDKEKGEISKPYPEVVEEIRGYLSVQKVTGELPDAQ